MRFRATIELNGRTATGIAVPEDVLAGLGAGRRPAVRVTLNGHTCRTSIGSMGGRSLLPVSAEVRATAGVAAGQDVDVDVELDTEPREGAVPPDLAEALAADGAARRAFDGLTYSNRRRLVLAIEQAKAAETRRRRVTQTVDRLREGRA